MAYNSCFYIKSRVCNECTMAEDGPVVFICKEDGNVSISISSLTLFTFKMVWLQFYVISLLTELLVVYLMNKQTKSKWNTCSKNDLQTMFFLLFTDTRIWFLKSDIRYVSLCLWKYVLFWYKFGWMKKILWITLLLKLVFIQNLISNFINQTKNYYATLSKYKNQFHVS